MFPDEKIGCHLTGFKEKCHKLVSSRRCNRWIQVQGTNPNTGEPINRYDCVDNWVPVLLMENSQMQRQTGAAVESFRNEMVRSNESSVQVLRSAIAIGTNGHSPKLIGNKE